MRPLFFDRHGKPISLKQYIQAIADEEYKRVAQDTIGPYWVSTVWLGVDHGWRGDTPLIFETMVFHQLAEERGVGLDMDMRRYATEEEALRGHEEMVTLVRATAQESFPDLVDGATDPLDDSK